MLGSRISIPSSALICRATGEYLIYERSTRVVAKGDFLRETTHIVGHDYDKVRAAFNEQVRRLFLKRARIEATIVRYLEPFREFAPMGATSVGELKHKRIYSFEGKPA